MPAAENTSEPSVTVIVPARNSAATIGRMLEGLARQDLDLAFEVIVVDDASGDETSSLAASADVRPRIIQGKGIGAGEARNTGARAARAPILAFTDADCEPQPSWLSEAVKALADSDLVQGAVLPDPSARIRPFDRTVRVVGEEGFYETANIVVRRELFERLGGFQDWIIQQKGIEPGEEGAPRRPFGEDMLFAWRARRGGARTAFASKAIVHHAVFRRGPLDYLRERLRLRYFPAIAKRIPELRGSTFFARCFLSARSAAFDLALAAALAALLAGTPLPLGAAAPYVWMSLRHALRAGWKWRLPVLAVGFLADIVGLGALAWGSLRYRSLLL